MAQEGRRAVDEARGGWWGRYELEPAQTGRWRIDTLQLWILRAEREWQIARAPVGPEDDEQREEWSVELGVDMPAEPEELERHVFAATRGPLELLPIVADRPVVTSPRVPLFVPPGEEATLYVGSPLWVRIEVESPAKLLAEIPIRRPSDTWFGPSTREGELCYATRTGATLDLNNLPTLARRAITPVVIENHGGEALRVDRLKLPVPYLSVHVAADGKLWTPEVTMKGAGDSGMATFELGRRPPAAVSARLLTPAREQPEPGLLIRAFGLFRHGSRED